MKNVYEKLFEFRKITGKVAKQAKNPFFKSKYADLNSVIEATDPAFEEVGLIYIDRVVNMDLVSEVIDPESGEVIQNIIPLILTRNDMQQLGSAITYARRYARMAICGLQAVDDDGNFVSGKVNTSAPKLINQTQLKTIQDLAATKGLSSEQVTQAWKMNSLSELRDESYEQMIKWLGGLK